MFRLTDIAWAALLAIFVTIGLALPAGAAIEDSDIEVIIPSLPRLSATPHAAISADGSLIAIFDDSGATIWDRFSMRMLRHLNDDGVAARLRAALSADGSRIVTMTTSGELGVWDTDTGKLLHRVPTSPYQNPFTELAMSPDGKYFARFDQDRVRVYETEKGKMVLRAMPPIFAAQHIIWTEKALMAIDGQQAVAITGPHFDSLKQLSAGGEDSQFIGFDNDKLIVGKLVKGSGDTLYQMSDMTLGGQSSPYDTLQLDGTSEPLFTRDGYRDLFRVNSAIFLSNGGIVLTQSGKAKPIDFKIESAGINFSFTPDGKYLTWMPVSFNQDATPIVLDSADLQNPHYYSGRLPQKLAMLNFAGTARHVTGYPETKIGNRQQRDATIADPETGENIAECKNIGPDGILFEDHGHFALAEPTDAETNPDCGADVAQITYDPVPGPDFTYAVPGVGIVSEHLPDGFSDVTRYYDFIRLHPQYSSIFLGDATAAVRSDEAISVFWDFSPAQTQRILHRADGSAFSLKSLSPFSETLYSSSADGSRMITSDAGNVVLVYDVATGRLINELGNCSVAAVQSGLIKMQLLSGQADGVFGDATRRAIIKLGQQDAHTIGEGKGYTEIPVDLVAFDYTDEQLQRFACGVFGFNASEYGSLARASLSADGRYAVVAAQGRNVYQVRVYDVDTGRVVFDQSKSEDDFYPGAEFTEDGSALAIFSDAAVDVVDLATQKSRARFALEGTRILSLRLAGDRATAIGMDYSAQTFDLDSGSLLSRYALGTNGEWSALTHDGFYAASENGASLLQITVGHTVLTPDNLAEVLYRPDLVAALADGDPNGLYKEAVENTSLYSALASGLAPTVTIDSIEEVPDDPASRKITLSVTAHNGGVGKILVQRGDTAIGIFDSPGGIAAGTTASVEGLIPVITGSNALSVTAFNQSGIVESDPAVTSFDAIVPEAPPTLYVLAVGINDYQGNLRLKYAVPDVRAFTDLLQTASKPLFSKIVVKRLLDQDATKAGLDAAFQELAPQVKTNDVFILFVSGHGITDQGHFYYAPADFVYRDQSSIGKQGIGDDQIQRWMVSINAQKSILLIDACESGTLTNLDFGARGLAEAVAIQRLNKAVGRSVITASAQTESALEGYNGHGVFTYSLIEALANGDNNQDHVIDLSELFEYVDKRVPQISMTAFGVQQTPQTRIQGTNFPLAEQTVSQELSNNGPFIPQRATHVLIARTDIYRDAALNEPSGETLEAGTRLAVVGDSDGPSIQVARDGSIVGYVASSSLVKLN